MEKKKFSLFIFFFLTVQATARSKTGVLQHSTATQQQSSPGTTKTHTPSEVHSFNVVAKNIHNTNNINNRIHTNTNKKNEVKPTSGIVLLQKHINNKEIHDKAKKRTGTDSKPNVAGGAQKQILEINPKPPVINAVSSSEKANNKNSIQQIKEQTHLTEPISLQAAATNAEAANIQNSMYPQPQENLYQKSYFNGYVQQPQQQMFYPSVATADTVNVAPTVPALVVGRTEKAVAKSKPCVPTPTNLCPTSPLNLFVKASKMAQLHSKQPHPASGFLANATIAEVQQMSKQPVGDENKNNKKLGAIKNNQLKLPIQAIQAEADKTPTHSSHGGKCINDTAPLYIKLGITYICLCR